KTSELYTDLSLMTSNTDIAKDAEEVFRTLSLGEVVENSGTLLVAPHCLQNKIVEMMDNEIAIAKNGGEGYVGAKLNSLTDKVLIDKIIECSQAGVKVELVIRGISCLIAGVEGVTENVQIRSIVGRYLEHARIYIFGSGVRKQVYISSADYMTRNTTRRVEVAAPVLDEEIKKRVLDIFDTQMSDNVKARIMQPDGTYVRAVQEGPVIDAQKRFYAESYANAPKTEVKPAEEVSAPPQQVQQTEQAVQNKTEAEENPPKKMGFFARLLSFFRRKK
ncbi:MAG: polyphosphate kinase 1, partial [Hominimerdicola sp.]